MQGIPKSLASRLGYAVLLCVVVAACAFTPLGYAVWFEDLKLHGDVTTAEEFPQEWDKSSLEVTGEGVYCDEAVTLGATVANAGDEDMAGPTTAILWYSEHGGPQKGAQVEGVEAEVPALPSGESVQITLPVPADGEGKPVFGQYWIIVYQRPGHPGTGETRSEGIKIDKKTCPVPDELLLDALTEEATAPPDEPPSPTPEPRDVSEREIDAPDLTPTPAPADDTQLTPAPPEQTPPTEPPEASPEPPPDPSPEPPPDAPPAGLPDATPES